MSNTGRGKNTTEYTTEYTNGRIITDASEVAKTFDAFYGSIADYPVNCEDGLNDINLIHVTDKYCHHESIVNIQLHMDVRVTCKKPLQIIY